jgi:hypothetical protein
MDTPDGVVRVTSDRASELANVLSEDGWRVVLVPGTVTDGQSLIEAIRDAVPFTLPYGIVWTWDGLVDLLFDGLASAENSRTAIVWPNAQHGWGRQVLEAVRSLGYVSEDLARARAEGRSAARLTVILGGFESSLGDSHLGSPPQLH